VRVCACVCVRVFDRVCVCVCVMLVCLFVCVCAFKARVWRTEREQAEKGLENKRSLV